MLSIDEINELEDQNKYLKTRNKELKKCYDSNLKLCKWQEQQINRFATAIEKIKKIMLETCLTCGECQTEFSQKTYCEINEVLEIITKKEEG